MSSNNMDTLPILSLPSEVTSLTASFLSLSDALHFVQTCKTLHSKLLLCLLHHSHILFTRKAWKGHNCSGHKDIPFLHILCWSHNVHSIMLTLQWRDQGWGYSKGKLCVISCKKNIPPDPSKHFYGGQVVWESEFAPKAMALCHVTFSMSTNEIYQLWFHVGTGGGHELHLRDGRLHMLISDDDQKNLVASYKSHKKLFMIAEKPQEEFGSLNVEGLHELIGTMGVDAIPYWLMIEILLVALLEHTKPMTVVISLLSHNTIWIYRYSYQLIILVGFFGRVSAHKSTSIPDLFALSLCN